MMTEFPIPEGDLAAAESEELLLMCGHAPGPEPLSPAARTVFEAFNSKFDWIEDGVPGPQFRAIAAALRAAAQHLYHDWSAFNCIDALCEIADELEGQDQ